LVSLLCAAMKTVAIRALPITLQISTVVLGAALVLLKAEPAQPDEKDDPWKQLRAFIGNWEGDVSGEPGAGKAEREYAFILNNRFIQVLNKSTYPPQEKNPKGEVHEDIGFYSYDKAARKPMLRQFHIEGFVNQFTLDKVPGDGLIVFVSTAIENIAPGWRARETYRIVSRDEFIETFALAKPGKDFATYSETHFRRKK
jgi:hypothetical protein